MYVAIRDAIIWHAGYRCVREGCEALGLDAVELAVHRDGSIPHPDAGLTGARCPGADAAGATAATDAYVAAGMHVAALMVACNLNAPDLQAEIDWVVGAVRTCRSLGGESVRIDAAMTGQNDVGFRRRAEIFAGAVRTVLDATQDCPVPIGMENHGLQGTDPEWIDAVLAAVGSPRFGLTLDTGNFYWAGLPLSEVYAAIDRFAPHVKHVHCKNISFAPGQRQQRRTPGWDYGHYVCPIPEGDVDHQRIIRTLAEAGYQGSLTVEDESLSKFSRADRRVQLQRDVDHLADLAQSVGGTRRYSGPAA